MVASAELTMPTAAFILCRVLHAPLGPHTHLWDDASVFAVLEHHIPRLEVGVEDVLAAAAAAGERCQGGETCE